MTTVVTTLTGRRVELSVDFTTPVVELKAEVARAVAQHNALADAIAGVRVEDVTCENTLERLSTATFLLYQLNEVIRIRRDNGGHDDDALHETLSSLNMLLASALAHTAYRSDINARISALHAQLPTLGASSDQSKALRALHGAGLRLDRRSSERLSAIQVQLQELLLCVDNETTCETLELSSEDLAGLPHHVLRQLSVADSGLYSVSVTQHLMHTILSLCSNARTRELVWREFVRLIPRSVVCAQALQTAALLRERACLLGHASHSASVTHSAIAKTTLSVTALLDDVHARATAAASRDTRDPWDVMYCATRDMLRTPPDGFRFFSYFMPRLPVVEQSLRLCGSVFGLCFEKVASIPAVLRWCEDVALYVVVDLATDVVIGALYLDLWSRPGKGAGGWTSNIRHRTKDSVPYVVVTCAMDQRTGFSHWELRMLLHELGHALHALCARGLFMETSWASVEDDFIETPSQVLEHWAWDAQALVFLSDNLLSLSAAEEVVRGRSASAADHLLLTVYSCRLDMVLSGPGPLPATESEVLAALDAPRTSDVDAGVCSNCHVYETLKRFPDCAGRMYGYLWGQVDAADLFDTLFRGMMDGKPWSCLDPAVAEAGLRYRRCVLEPGAMVDAADILQHALGRPPSAHAFFRLNGL